MNDALVIDAGLAPVQDVFPVHGEIGVALLRPVVLALPFGHLNMVHRHSVNHPGRSVAVRRIVGRAAVQSAVLRMPTSPALGPRAETRPR